MSGITEKIDLQDTPLATGGRTTIHQFIGELSFFEWVRAIRHGLTQPHDSGEYRFAHQEIKRLWSPVVGIGFPCLLTFVILLAPQTREKVSQSMEIIVGENKPVPELNEIKAINDEKPVPPPEFVPAIKPPEANLSWSEAQSQPGSDFIGPPGLGETGDNILFSPKPSERDTVAYVKSPVRFNGIYAGREPGAIGSLAGKWGKGGGPGGGGTEDAVYRALRWLKKYQDTDGKWTTATGGSQAGGEGPCSPAMTGLALLTFLAHGETPTTSKEFGPTVRRGLQWLVDNQQNDGHFAQSDGNEYSLPIAAYALCEAFAMTKVPELKEAAQKSIEAIVKGQNAQGLWTYKCQTSDRSDTSYGGWCAQAVKAAVMAGLEVNGLRECAYRAIAGLKANYSSGGFGYTSPGNSQTLTPVGVLCLQLLGKGTDPAITGPLDGMLKNATCDWQNPRCADPLYSWYYLTQAKFHRGEGEFKPWNQQFAPALMKNQVIVTNAIEGTNGQMVSIGYWNPASQSEKCKAYCYNTTLCTLMLTVYYRHLPTYSASDAAETEVSFARQDDIKVQVR